MIKLPWTIHLSKTISGSWNPRLLIQFLLPLVVNREFYSNANVAIVKIRWTIRPYWLLTLQFIFPISNLFYLLRKVSNVVSGKLWTKKRVKLPQHCFPLSRKSTISNLKRAIELFLYATNFPDNRKLFLWTKKVFFIIF